MENGRSNRARRFARIRLTALSGVLALTAAIGIAGANAHAAPTFAPPPPGNTIGKASTAFIYPFGLAWDPTTPGGSLLATDYTNYDIKRFSASGTYTNSYSIAPIYEQPSSIAVNPTNGTYVVAFAFDGFGYEQFSTSGKLLCTANLGQAAWYSPYIAVNPSTGYVFLVQSTNLAPSGPNEVFMFDNNCNLLPQQTFPVSTGTQCGSVGGKTPVAPQFGIIRGIDVDSQGNVYVNDVTNQCVQVFTSSGVFEGSFGNKTFSPKLTPKTGLSLDTRGLAIDRTNNVLYIADNSRQDVDVINFKLNTTGTTTGQYKPGSATFAGTIGTSESSVGGTCTGQGVLDGPRDIAVGPNGALYVSDYTCWTVDTFNPLFATTAPGGWLNQVPDPSVPPPPGGFNGPTGIAVSSDGTSIYVADTFNERMEEFTGLEGVKPGTFVQQWGSRQPNLAGSFSLDYPRGVAVDPANGNVWVSDTRSGFIKEFTTSLGPPATVTAGTSFGSQGISPGQFFYSDGIAVAAAPVGASGEALYIPDSGIGYFQVTDQAGDVLAEFPCGIVTGTPTVITGCPTAAVTFDSLGDPLIFAPSINQGWVDEFAVVPNPGIPGYPFPYVGEQIATIGSTAPGGTLSSPDGVAVSGTTLYVTQENANEVSEFSTIDGSYLGSWSSWTNPTTHKTMTFNKPMGIAVDNAGDIYVVDHGNDRVDVFS
jgi:DNA-binding beta-propeller fold protein YncE